MAVLPPSTASFAPWTKLERSVARNTTASAISSAVAGRPAGASAALPLHRGFDRLNLSLKVARAAVWDQRAVRCCGMFLAAFGSSPPVRASAASDEPRVG